MKATMSQRSIPPTQAAVVDIGAHSVRMEIVQFAADGSRQTLEELSHPIPIGRDVFRRGEILPRNINLLGEILRDFRTRMDEYGVKVCKAFATSAVREAVNRDIFINRIRHLSGIEVEVLEASEEIRLFYLAVRNALRARHSLAGRNAVICIIGTGSTQICQVRKGSLRHAETYRLGTLRMIEEIGGEGLSSRKFSDVIDTFVRGLVDGVAENARDERPELFVAVGATVRVLTALGQKVPEHGVRTITRRQLEGISRRVSGVPADKLAVRYRLSDTLAQSLEPCCHLLEHFFDITAAERLVVPMISTRDAIIEDLVREIAGETEDPFAPEILAAARFVGEQYRYDAAHAANVADNVLALFDATAALHGCDARSRLLLHVAAILHDIGQFVNNRSHHKHSHYLILNSQLPGVSPREQALVAAIARYHRRGQPKPSHVEYMTLTSEDRAMVAKLAALLRIADALDRSHEHRLVNPQIAFDEERLTIRSGDRSEDLTVERLVMKGKADLFEGIFGLHVVLE
jgi:exopolyphosphatase/guanosine-5'-triphosphate,3'-diphosphate pyrophosphatase